ncbi:Protein-export membrane protein SecG [Polystyrenella longa]|uniref:Protein-export membrane protein SecG n=1 Tax=Polystyrenella longa TaxID=2528007 RepID=A0A518CKT8_9PLAN|nr:preprotein translocase subunit SecG [Polystyrenella longa]QDU79836.1 Protein-export membrane protein SecG [Polystyrenella longa]
MPTFLVLLLILVGLFLMLIVLIQKGRGGGLAGAFGGAGGQSAFGTKAGDVFTKITIVVATIWFVLSAITGMVISAQSDKLGDQFKGAETSLSAPDGLEDGTAGSAEAGSGVVEEEIDFETDITVPEDSGSNE